MLRNQHAYKQQTRRNCAPVAKLRHLSRATDTLGRKRAVKERAVKERRHAEERLKGDDTQTQAQQEEQKGQMCKASCKVRGVAIYYMADARPNRTVSE